MAFGGDIFYFSKTSLIDVNETNVKNALKWIENLNFFNKWTNISYAIYEASKFGKNLE